MTETDKDILLIRTCAVIQQMTGERKTYKYCQLPPDQAGLLRKILGQELYNDRPDEYYDCSSRDKPGTNSTRTMSRKLAIIPSNPACGFQPATTEVEQERR